MSRRLRTAFDRSPGICSNQNFEESLRVSIDLSCLLRSDVGVGRVIASSHNAREFYDAMIRLYPDRKNRSALWFWGAKELFKP